MTALAVEPLESEQLSEVLHHWQSTDHRFSRALESGLSPAQALARLGVRLCGLERYADSLTVLHAAVTLNPADAALWSNLAVVLDRAGQTPAAIISVRHSLALDHQQPDSWLYLGNLQKSQGDFPAAQTAYETSLALQPASPFAWQNLGLLKKEQRQFHEAIPCFLHAIEQSPPSAPLLSILAQLYYSTGQFQKSRDAYGGSLALDPENPLYQRMHRELEFLNVISQGRSVDDALQACFAVRNADPVKNDKETLELLHSTFSLLSAYGPLEAAQRLGQKIVQLAPASATAAYLLQAITGNSTLPRSPDTYLIEHFDHFADQFDRHLTQTLGYDIPQKLSSLLAVSVPPNCHLNILDAGCGTGLCAPHLRPFASTLTGVDLSPRMLDHARQRQLYEHLVCAELTTFLNDSPAAYQAIIAADVFIYFGDLAPLAAAFAHALQRGGLLAFSIEDTTASTPQLLRSGRFVHHPDYIRCTFSPYFTECTHTETTLRLEAAHPVPGHLFLLRRR